VKPQRVSLTNLSKGNRAVICDVDAGWGLRRHLLELGFVQGTEIRILKNERGPVIIALGESRIALGRGAAQKILVQVLGNDF
jgi:ferrous iron transport protein A